MHPYPAKFIIEIPRALLEVLPFPPGATVLDPFCGSGATLVECQRRGLPSVGIDLNPIACLMTRVKTTPVPTGIERAIEQVIQRTCHIKSPPIPAIPNLDHWFEKPIQEALSTCTAAIAMARPNYHDILRLALSSIIVRVSNQDSDTRYAAVPKNVDAEDVFSSFVSAARRIVAVLSARPYSLSSATVIEADTLALSPGAIGRPVGVVITSPPYPNAYEYWLYHKYRMWWLGFDPIAVKEQEIGARAHFFGAKHHTAKHFADQMARTFELLRSLVIPGGFVCFLVGRSKIHGEIIDNASTLEAVALASGFSRVFRTERTISQYRKSFNLSHAKIKTETLLVLRRASA